MNPMLEARNLTKRFGDVTALHAITFALPPGRIAGLIGRNGSGKTTLLNHFAGLWLPTSGECLTLGTAARDLGSTELSQLGFVSQPPRFIEWMTVRQHLRYVSSFYRTWDHAREQRLRHELDLLDKPRLATLSTGDRQKFAIICAVCHHPKLLLLDEPFNALDPIVRMRTLALFIELAREDESTILVSSHILHDVEKVIDWVICLHEGRLVSNRSFDQLQESYAEWTVTARSGDLPPRFSEPFVLKQEGDSRQARLQVHNPSQHEAGFRSAYDVDLTSRPLNLEQQFPLLISRQNHP